MRKSKCSFLLLLIFCFLGHNFSFAKPVALENKSLVMKKQERVVRLYERKRYARANELIEELLPLLSRAECATFQFYQAYCNYYEQNYQVSSNQFHLFVKQHPFSLNVEEAVFMCGYSLACVYVDTRLDQTITYDAIQFLEQYLIAYPTGAYQYKATEALQNLQQRLMKKSFEEASLYVRLGYYNAAIVALKNFKKAYPDSLFKEAVCSLLVKSDKKLTEEKGNRKKDSVPMPKKPTE